MTQYQMTAQDQAQAPQQLPQRLKQLLTVPSGSPVLILALHPQCSCSRATLHELRRVLDAAGARPPAVYILLFRPSRRPAEWRDEGVFSASSLPRNATVLPDEDGQFAASLHADTSGEVVLYGGDDHLLFQGGVTASRGHEGPSAGSERLQATLRSGTAASGVSSVFGCNLFHRDRTTPDKL